MPEQGSLGQEIRRLRVASGLSVAELATRTGIRAAYLADIEDDREEPSAAALARIASHFDRAGGSFEHLAHFLKAPELDVSGEYTSQAGPGTMAVDRDRRGVSGTDRDGVSASPVEPPISDVDLQFDRVIAGTGPDALPAEYSVTCAACRAAITTEYYDVNGHNCCSRCRGHAESRAETPRGVVPFAIAALFGFGAALGGAVIYYAVLAIAHIEIGFVAILTGYMVGYAVRKGAGGRGGRRFQVLAVALTYVSIALAYTPVAVTGAIEANRKAQQARTAASGGTSVPANRPRAASTPRGGFLLAIVGSLALIIALPVLVVVGSFPVGLIGGFIIFFGMRQAWSMTRAPWVQVLGPYRVGAATAPA